MPTTREPSPTDDPSSPTARARRRVAYLALAAGLLLGACGGSDDEPQAISDPAAPADAGDAGADDEGDPGELGDDLGSTAPEECRELFPLQLETASLDELTLVPDGWPEAPSDSTLCSVKATINGGTETAGYVTDLTPEEVIAHYADQLGPEFGAVEEEGSFGGPALVGTIGDIGWQVDTRIDGTFQLGFGGS